MASCSAWAEAAGTPRASSRAWARARANLARACLGDPAMMTIPAFYASLLTALYLFLSMRVIGWRKQQRVEIGHGEDAQLLRRMRVHANFAEYAPFALLLMALAESLGPP